MFVPVKAVQRAAVRHALATSRRDTPRVLGSLVASRRFQNSNAKASQVERGVFLSLKSHLNPFFLTLELRASTGKTRQPVLCLL